METEKILLKCINIGSYHLTVGKVYQGFKYDFHIFEYKIINDKGIEHGVESGLFIDLQKHRLRQLNKIGI
jgi:hypothetical protein